MSDQDYENTIHYLDQQVEMLEQQVAELEVQAHNRNEHISDLEQENERLSRAWMNLQKRASADKVTEMEQQLAKLEETYPVVAQYIKRLSKQEQSDE